VAIRGAGREVGRTRLDAFLNGVDIGLRGLNLRLAHFKRGLLFVVFLAANQVLFGQWSGKPLQPRIGSWLIFLPLGIASLVYFQHSFSGIDRHTWFLAHFHKFLLGAFAAWAISSRDLRPLFWCFLACFAAEVVFHSFDLATAIAAFTALGIYFGACFPQIAARADSGLSRYFGRISYSLYLLHVPVGFSIWSIGRRLAGHSSAWRDAWIVISILASIAAAHLMYRAVESTSVKFSQRFKRTKIITPALDRNSGLTPS
jgi:peptidoglycan/LPS O-acetylase OafA/YrhL